MNQNCYQEEVEIDLIQFCKRLLVQWRAIVAVALIFGLLVMVGKYILDVRSIRSVSNTTELSKEELLESLSDEEREKVDLAVNAQQQIDYKEKYVENSLYMGLNDTNFRCLEMQYRIDTDESIDACDVSYLYYVNLLSDESIRLLGKVSGVDCDEQYIREIYNVGRLHENSEKRRTDFLTISFYLSDEMDESKVTEAIKQVVEDNRSEIEEQFDYQISLVRCEINKPSGDLMYKIQNNQKTIRSELISSIESQKERLSAFSDVQKKLYEESIDDTENSSESLNADINDAVTNVQNATFSKKYFAIGFLAGIILYIGLFFAYVVLSSRAVELNVAGVTNMPCLGMIKRDKCAKNPILTFLTLDKMVYNLIYRDSEMNLSRPENIVGRMKAYTGEKETTRFHILQPGFELNESDAMRELIGTARDMGVEVSAEKVDASDISDIISKLNEDIPIIISVYESKTKKKDLYTLYEVIKNKKIDVLGELYVK